MCFLSVSVHTVGFWASYPRNFKFLVRSAQRFRPPIPKKRKNRQVFILPLFDKIDMGKQIFKNICLISQQMFSQNVCCEVYDIFVVVI